MNNIVLSGGTTMLSGFTERMTDEMSHIMPEGESFKVISPSDRKYSAWIGGSILASLSTFKDFLVTKAEYQEHGINIIFRKFAVL